uniref:SAP domain-containing protein n=1 Tax=Ditylenchus dipsaci TaxID=166011 RepID=A0A915DEK3_9BILA
MISKEELEKLTVAQIKEKLKSRKLSTAGTKPDLVTRLHENIVAEEKLLGTGLESAGPSEFDLDNVDVDEVLGLLDNDPAISSPDQPQQKKKTSTVVKQATKPPPVIATTVTAKPAELTAVEKPVEVEQPAVPKKEPKKPIAPPAGVASTKTAVKPVLNGKAEETTTTTTLTTTDAGATDKKTPG